jgi:hypothetical protein
MKSHDLAALLLEYPNVYAMAYDPESEEVKDITGVLFEEGQILVQTDSEEEE